MILYWKYLRFITYLIGKRSFYDNGTFWNSRKQTWNIFFAFFVPQSLALKSIPENQKIARLSAQELTQMERNLDSSARKFDELCQLQIRALKTNVAVDDGNTEGVDEEEENNVDQEDDKDTAVLSWMQVSNCISLLSLSPWSCSLYMHTFFQLHCLFKSCCLTVLVSFGWAET